LLVFTAVITSITPVGRKCKGNLNQIEEGDGTAMEPESAGR
jgi:hypothetical protein